MTSYTRVYPIIDATSYDPTSNQLLEAITCSIGAASGTLNNVPGSIHSVVDTGLAGGEVWYVTITNGAYVNTYNIDPAGVPYPAGDLDLLYMDGTAFTSSAAETGIRALFFRGDVPSAYDNIPAAILFDALGAGPFEFITLDGQFVSIPVAALVVQVVYPIAIRTVVNANGCTGFLFGNAGFNGSPIYPY